MIPRYLCYCVTMALFRRGDYVPDRLSYLILCMPKGERAEALYAGT